MLFRIHSDCEIFIDNRKLLFKNEQLFHIQERDDTDDWSFDYWRGNPVMNKEIVDLFRSFVKRFAPLFQSLQGIEIAYNGETRRIDRWEEVIMTAIKKHPNGFVFKDLYYDIAMQLGADNEEMARKGYAYHPYTGKRIHVERCFATWITERSPDSRQRYFFGGEISNKKLPLLFVNDELYQSNQQCNWQPFNPDGKRNHVRGGLWRYDPIAAGQRIVPDIHTLMEAQKQYSCKGVQGKRINGPGQYTMIGVR